MIVDELLIGRIRVLVLWSSIVITIVFWLVVMLVMISLWGLTI